MKKFLPTLFFVLLVSLQIFAQGQIFDKNEADNLFGSVLVTKEIPTENLRSILSQSENKIMFNVIDNTLYILDNNRNLIIPSGGSVNSSTVFSVFGISVTEELLDKGGSSSTYIEIRNEVLTITNGNFTMDMSEPCPPVCG